MRILTVKVANKVATYIKNNERLVCGNSDFAIEFAFDGEWFDHHEKIARFVWGGKFHDVPFKGTTCPVPVVFGTDEIRVGVYAGDLCATTPAVIPCLKSVLCATDIPLDEDEHLYVSAALEAAEEAKQAAEEAKAAAGGGGTVANALKGTATGAAVRMDDVSPLPHEMAVNVWGKNLIDFRKARYRNNALTITYTENGIIIPSGFNYYFVIPCDVKAGETVVFNCEFTGGATIGTFTLASSDGSTNAKSVLLGKPITAELDADYVWVYKESPSTATTAETVVTNMQLEYGSTATAYAPYIEDISAVTVLEQGKNLIDADTVLTGLGYVKQEDGSYYGTPFPPTTIFSNTSRVAGAFTIQYDGKCNESGLTATPLVFRVSYTDGTKEFVASFGTNATEEYVHKSQSTNSSKTVDYIEISYGTAHRYAYIRNLQIECGTETAYAPYIAPTEYAVNADGTVDGVTAIHPTTTLMTDTEGAVMDVGYNRDINDAFAKLLNAIISLGGNV